MEKLDKKEVEELIKQLDIAEDDGQELTGELLKEFSDGRGADEE